MIKRTIVSQFGNIWPMLLIFSVIIISLRIAYLLQNKEKFVFYKEILNLFFVLYIMILFHVVTFQDVSWSTSNFIPFKEMFRYDIKSRLFYKNVIGNMIMFFPYGFFVSQFLHIKKKWKILLLAFLASFTIEITQLLIGRVFDIDDIILNLIGSFFGFLIYRLLYLSRYLLPKILKNEWFYNIITLILTGICLLVIAVV